MIQTVKHLISEEMVSVCYKCLFCVIFWSLCIYTHIEKPLPPDCNPVSRQPDIAESAELSALLEDITDTELWEMEEEAMDTNTLIGCCQSHDSMDELMLEALTKFEDQITKAEGQSTDTSSAQSETNYYNISAEEINSFFDDIDNI